VKTALITGIYGQDAAYLASFLINLGYMVYGSYRASSNPAAWRLEELGILRHKHLRMVPCELMETTNVQNLIEKVRPDEVYNLAAQCSLTMSHEMPEHTMQANGLGTLRLLTAIRSINPKIKFFQASSSEMFGTVTTTPQDETTPFHPRNPYGVAKLMAHWSVVNFRDNYGLHASNGIFYNHESPLRAKEFLSRKIVSSFVDLKRGKITSFEIGNLEAQRDWGFAGDYVEAAWQMLQQPKGGDYVIASGETHTVRDFVDRVALHMEERISWHGEGLHEHGVDKRGNTVITVSKAFYRPSESPILCGHAAKAQKVLHWHPQVNFDGLIQMMVEAELAR
jgi:GDPmannose 4,6-dehydratase